MVMSSQRQPTPSVPDSDIRFRLLFENSMDGILLTSPNGRILDANPSACSILGRTRTQIIAEGREGVLDTSDPALAFAIEERKRTGRFHGELTARRSDGSRFPMEVSSVIFPDAEGSEFTCIIIRDISSRKRAEAERERLVTELTDALAKIKTLTGLLPICSSCKKIRDDAGNWIAVEVYFRDRTEADFSHGICPECAKVLYPDYYKKRN
jgi:PAS domain S-box-containing protein